MSKKKMIWLTGAMLIILGVFRAGIVVGAGSSVPGSSGDPLVTLSYLESRISKANASIGSEYQMITLKKNQILLLENGGEVILYSGSATITGTKGMVNLTTGSVYQSGNSIDKYQLFLSPASTSGLKASANVTTYVKGDYSIK